MLLCAPIAYIAIIILDIGYAVAIIFMVANIAAAESLGVAILTIGVVIWTKTDVIFIDSIPTVFTDIGINIVPMQAVVVIEFFNVLNCPNCIAIPAVDRHSDGR